MGCPETGPGLGRGDRAAGASRHVVSDRGAFEDGRGELALDDQTSIGLYGPERSKHHRRGPVASPRGFRVGVHGFEALAGAPRVNIGRTLGDGAQVSAGREGATGGYGDHAVTDRPTRATVGGRAYLARLVISPYADRLVFRVVCCWPRTTPGARPVTWIFRASTCPMRSMRYST
jgi:hypothetical protein